MINWIWIAQNKGTSHNREELKFTSSRVLEARTNLTMHSETKTIRMWALELSPGYLGFQEPMLATKAISQRLNSTFRGLKIKTLTLKEISKWKEILSIWRSPEKDLKLLENNTKHKTRWGRPSNLL